MKSSLWRGSAADFPQAKKAFGVAPLFALPIPVLYVSLGIHWPIAINLLNSPSPGISMESIIVFVFTLFWSYAVTFTYGLILYRLLTRSNKAGRVEILVSGAIPGLFLLTKTLFGYPDSMMTWSSIFVTIEGLIIAGAFWLIGRGVLSVPFLDSPTDQRGLGPQKL